MKLTPVIAIFSLAVLVIACSKDKFQTNPRLEVKDYSTKEIVQGDQLRIRVDYFDKEGDLSDGLITYIRVRTNKNPIPNPGVNDKIDTITSALPTFPEKSTGEITLKFDYNYLDEDPDHSDTMFFRVMVVDKAGNKSDTISTQSVTAVQ